MNALWLLISALCILLLAYRLYGRFLAYQIFKLTDTHTAPSMLHNDGCDYVPSKTGIVFGHHFTSIAGTGPIVGPAIGVIWGWVPAVLWILFGSVLIGAVHDFGSMVISMRHDGRSIVDVTAELISPRVRLLFFVIVFFALLIVIAIFGLVIALIFKQFPHAVLPVWCEIPIAIALGMAIKAYPKRQSLAFWLAKLGFIATFFLGLAFPIELGEWMGIPATGLWTIGLLAYAYIASTLNVSTLLQPRDYLNAWQLYGVMAVLVFGIVVSAFVADMSIAAPIVRIDVPGAPSIWPFLFITIACGAVSGFHSLVASGTTSKQLKCETNAQCVGYGGMLVEALLAIMVVIAVTAGLGLGYTSGGETLVGEPAWMAHYGSWTSSSGLASKLNAVVIGMSNIIANTGIPMSFAVVVMGVFIASFAGTTLDSATRIQRYIIAELCADGPFKSWSNKWAATAIAVLSGAILAFSSGANGHGALMLWPLFGAINQLLAALALLVITVYIRKKGGMAYLLTLIPFAIMMTVTVWASISNHLHFFQEGQWLLVGLNGAIVVLAGVMIVESILLQNRYSYYKS